MQGKHRNWCLSLAKCSRTLAARQQPRTSLFRSALVACVLRSPQFAPCIMAGVDVIWRLLRRRQNYSRQAALLFSVLLCCSRRVGYAGLRENESEARALPVAQWASIVCRGTDAKNRSQSAVLWSRHCGISHKHALKLPNTTPRAHPRTAAWRSMLSRFRLSLSHSHARVNL